MSRAGLISAALALGVLGGVLVAWDAMLSQSLPRGFWDELGLEGSPVRLAPLALALLAALLLLSRALRRVASLESFCLAVLIIAAQTNGLRVGPLDTFDLALFVTVLLWIAFRGMDSDRVVSLPPLFFFTGGLLVLVFAHVPQVSSGTLLLSLVGVSRILVLVFLILNLCRDRKTLDFALNLLIAVAAASALIGIILFALANTGIFAFTFIRPFDSAYKPTPFGFLMRASGPAVTAQHFSSFLVYALPLALWRMSHTWRARDIAIVATIISGVVVSLNYGGIFASLLVVALFPFLRWPMHSFHIVLGYAAAAALAYEVGIAQLAWEMSFGDAGVAKGLDQRAVLMLLGFEKIDANPLIGTGLGGFANVDGNFWHRPVHNTFIQAASELGVPAAVLLLVIFVYLTVSLLWIMLSGDRATYGTAAALFTTLMAALLLSQNEPNLDQSNLWMMMSLSQVAIVMAGRRAPQLNDGIRQQHKSQSQKRENRTND